MNPVAEWSSRAGDGRARSPLWATPSALFGHQDTTGGHQSSHLNRIHGNGRGIVRMGAGSEDNVLLDNLVFLTGQCHVLGPLGRPDLPRPFLTS